MALSAQIRSVMQVSAPLVWKAFREPSVKGLLAAVATVIPGEGLAIQRGKKEDEEYVLFEPWQYLIKSQDWDDEKVPYRGGHIKPVEVPVFWKHLTEKLPAVDFEGRNPPRQNLLKASDVITAMARAFERDPGEFVARELSRNVLLGYDGEPTFSNNHTSLDDRPGLSNIGRLGIDFDARAAGVNNYPTITELYDELHKIRERIISNQYGNFDFQSDDAIGRMAVFARGDMTHSRFSALNRRRYITRNGKDEDNDLRGQLHVFKDVKYADRGLSPLSYDVVVGGEMEQVDTMPYALSVVRRPGQMEWEKKFGSRFVYFGVDFALAIGPFDWRGSFRVDE